MHVFNCLLAHINLDLNCADIIHSSLGLKTLINSKLFIVIKKLYSVVDTMDVMVCLLL